MNFPIYTGQNSLAILRVTYIYNLDPIALVIFFFLSLKESLPSALVLIDYFDLTITDPDERSFYLEANLTTFRVFANGPLAVNEATLRQPNGKIHVYLRMLFWEMVST